MAIDENLKKILESRYGQDVRQAIHDAIQECYSFINPTITLFDPAIKSYSNSIVIGARTYTLTDTYTFTNCVLLGGIYKRTGQTSRTNLFVAKEYCTFIGCSFSSEYTAVPYLDSSGNRVSNVVAVTCSSGHLKMMGCNFNKIFGLSVIKSSAAAYISCFVNDCVFENVEMGIYSDASDIKISNSTFTISNTNSSEYHALYIPSFSSLSVVGCDFEYISGGTKAGNLVHLYSPNVSDYPNIARFTQCKFVDNISPAIRSYAQIICSSCFFEFNETACNIAMDGNSKKVDFMDCRFANRSTAGRSPVVRLSSSTRCDFNNCRFLMFSGSFVYGEAVYNNCNIDILGTVVHNPENTKMVCFKGCMINANTNTFYANANADLNNTPIYYNGCLFYATSSTFKMSTFDKKSKFTLKNCEFNVEPTTSWKDYATYYDYYVISSGINNTKS